MGGAMRHFYWVVFISVSFFAFLGFHLDSVKATQMASVSQLREVTTTLTEYGYPDITVSDSAATFLPFSGSVSETDRRLVVGFPLRMVRLTRIHG